MNPLNSSKEQLVIESLFADGFIKYSAGKEKPNIPSIKVLSLYETIIPNSSHSMEWDCQDFGFGMRLQKDVPIKIARHLQQYLRELCAKANLDYNAIKHDAIFAIHPGGPKIIQQIQEGLCLDMWQVEHSKQVLLQHGNMSSATLPHVWQSVLSDTHIEGKTYIVSMAFGPGLTISGGLLQKEG
jgi:predicted naringenin-chalcone synthase